MEPLQINLIDYVKPLYTETPIEIRVTSIRVMLIADSDSVSH